MADTLKDLDSELSVLGVLLNSPKRPESVAAIARLRDVDFADPRHAAIYRVLSNTISSGKRVDRAIVASDLTAAGQSSAAAYMPELPAFGSAASMETYADRVIDRSRGRACSEALRDGLGKLSSAHAVSLDVVRVIAESVSALASKSERHDWVSMRRVMGEEMARMQAALKGEAPSGIPTGFVDLDRETGGGMHRGDMVVVAAQSGGGKSTFAHGIAAHVMGTGRSVLIFSMEMSRQQIAQRMLAHDARIDSAKLRDGKPSDHEFPKIGPSVARLGVDTSSIDDSSSISIAELRAKCVRHKLEIGLDLVIVDYIQLALPSGSEQNREREVAAMSRGLKAIAKDLDVPVIVLSQLNDDGRVRESRAIKHDCDVLLTVTIERDNDGDGEPTGEARVVIDKQRMGPAPKKIKLVWDKVSASFRNATKGGKNGW